MIGTLGSSINQNVLQIPGTLQRDISHAKKQTTRIAIASLQQCLLSEMPSEIKAHIWSYVEPRDIAKISPFLCKSLRIFSKDRSHIIGLQIERHAGRVEANALVEYQKFVGDVGAQEEWLATLGKITEVGLEKASTKKNLESAILLFPYCKNIKKISMNYSIFDGELFEMIRSLSGLQDLDLSNCGFITDEGLRVIAPHLTKLQSLDLSSCEKITDEGFRAIMPHLIQLQYLDLSETHITGEGLRAIAPHLTTKLRQLDLSWTQITDEGLRAITPYLTNLQSLNFVFCRYITDAGLRAIAPCLTNLQYLALSGTRITDEGLRAITSCLLSIQHLNFSYCLDITDEGLRASAPYLTNLQSVNFTECNITEEGLRAIAPYLTNLDTLFVAEFHCINDRRKIQQWLAQGTMQ